MANSRRGRPRRYAEFKELYRSLPTVMAKRPKYLKGIGVFRGSRGDTAWIKIRLPNGGIYKGRTFSAGTNLEIKVGNLKSWSWQQLIDQHALMQGRADRGEPLQDEVALTFEVWATQWLERLKVRAKAFDTSEIHVRVHILPVFGTQQLSEIGISEINSWIARRLAEAAPGTVKRQFNTLRAIFNDAVRAGKIENNPCKFADPIKGIATRNRFLQIGELVELVARASDIDPWFSDFILWSVHSGMRRGEILSLLWPSVRKVDDGKAVVIIETSKADRPRLVSCTPTMMGILNRQLDRKLNGDNRVFPIALSTLKRRWEKVLKDTALSDVRLHDLRRTHATHIAASGVDLNTVAGRIGHTDLTMLQTTYAALTESADQGMVKIIEDLFGNGVIEKPDGDKPVID